MVLIDRASLSGVRSPIVGPHAHEIVQVAGAPANRPFCFVVFTTTSAVMDVGGALPESARKALQMMPLFVVARIRADPEFTGPAPRLPLNPNPTAPPVANLTLPPGRMSSDVALGSLTAAAAGIPEDLDTHADGRTRRVRAGKEKSRDHRH